MQVVGEFSRQGGKKWHFNDLISSVPPLYCADIFSALSIGATLAGQVYEKGIWAVPVNRKSSMSECKNNVCVCARACALYHGNIIFISCSEHTLLR